MQIMTINEFANKCGYLYNAELDPKVSHAPNGGYNCRHPKQEEKYNGVGRCFQWSCPLAIPADEEDCKKYGYEYEEYEFVLIEEKELNAMDRYDLDIYFLDSSEPVTVTIKADSYEEAEEKSQFWINKFRNVREIYFHYYHIERHIVN